MSLNADIARLQRDLDVTKSQRTHAEVVYQEAKVQHLTRLQEISRKCKAALSTNPGVVPAGVASQVLESSLVAQLAEDRFVAVILDMDTISFLDEFLRDGARGGKAAAQTLSRCITQHIENTLRLPANMRVVVFAVADMDTLTHKAMSRTLLQPKKDTKGLHPFAAGFAATFPHYCFLYSKDEASTKTKITETLNNLAKNQMCCHVIFAVHENDFYADALTSISKDRLTLISAGPVHERYDSLGVRAMSAKSVFRDRKTRDRKVETGWWKNINGDGPFVYEEELAKYMVRLTMVDDLIDLS